MQSMGFSLQWLLFCSELGLWGALASVDAASGLTVAAPRLSSRGSVVEAHGLSCCVASGIFPVRVEPLSPALVGGVFTTEPPGKPSCWNSNKDFQVTKYIYSKDVTPKWKLYTRWLGQWESLRVRMDTEVFSEISRKQPLDLS